MENSKILIRNAAQIVTCHGDKARRGAEMSDLGVIEDGAVAMSDGVITHVGPTEEVLRNIHAEDYLEIRAENQAVLPGFVDSHTHFIFGGYREEEFSWRLRGDSYMSIMERGGGIVNTMKATRESDFDTLWDRGEERLDELFSMGVTTVEGKSGYGLDLQTELVQLRVMSDLNESHPMDVVSTFLGAHAVPPEFAGRTDDYVDYMIEEVLPAIRAEHTVTFCDVFCETGVFTVEEARRILETGKKYGLIPKIHADEIEAIGGSQLAGNIGAISAEHLIVCPLEGIEQMAKGGTIACLLPATSFYLGANYAPAREMIQRGVPVAMATDFNPGSCPCLNLQLVINLGCLKYRMTPEEVLTAVTLNAAAAIGVADRIGTIEIGKKGDLIIWEAPDLDYICYRLGSDLVRNVVKAGKKIR